MAVRSKSAWFPSNKHVVVPPSQVERVLKYLRGEIKVPVVDRCQINRCLMQIIFHYFLAQRKIFRLLPLVDIFVFLHFDTDDCRLVQWATEMGERLPCAVNVMHIS